jgi:hypothetical protein
VGVATTIGVVTPLFQEEPRPLFAAFASSMHVFTDRDLVRGENMLLRELQTAAEDVRVVTPIKTSRVIEASK